MKKWIIIVFAILLFVVLSPVAFRKYTVPLMSNGRVVATARRPFALPWKDNEFAVYAGNAKVFSFWGDIFHFPLFIYPFADGQRFLCIDDDDTAILVFVIDCNASGATFTNLDGWPPDDYTRKYLAERAPHVVKESKGVVRLPSYAEVQEVSSNLAGMATGQFEKTSFPGVDFGVYRIYWPKAFLLSELSTNRHSVW